MDTRYQFDLKSDLQMADIIKVVLRTIEPLDEHVCSPQNLCIVDDVHLCENLLEKGTQKKSHMRTTTNEHKTTIRL